MECSDEDLPSLDFIFSKTASSVQHLEQKENIPVPVMGMNQNRKNVSVAQAQKASEKSKTLDNVQVKSVESSDTLSPSKVQKKNTNLLTINTAVFAKHFYKQQFVPAVILENIDGGKYYKVRYFDGDIQHLSRLYIFSPDDGEFFKIQVMPLKQVQREMNDGSDNFKVKVKELIREVESFKRLFLEILTGATGSERDVIFRKSIQTRHKLNLEMRPGPFSYAERDFLMDFLSNMFIPSLLKSEPSLVGSLENRFECKNKGELSYLLRQYAQLVLLPEWTLRIIMKRNEDVKTLEEANQKLLFSDEFDLSNGNYIHYLYSKQEMYTYARRDRQSTDTEKKKSDSSEEYEDEEKEKESDVKRCKLE